MIYTPKEAAVIMKVTRQTVYRWIEWGWLNPLTRGRGYGIPESEIRRFASQSRDMSERKAPNVANRAFVNDRIKR